MRRFGYLSDGLFLCSVALYAINRWEIKPHTHSPFFHGQFSDVLMIPAALPVLLFCQRKLGLRRHDRVPEIAEVFLYLTLWSAMFEFVGPYWLHWTTGDPLDVIAYLAGAIGSAVWWHRDRLRAWGAAHGL